MKAPAIVKATFVKQATADGLVEIAAGVQLGTEYHVDLATMREVGLYNKEKGVTHLKLVVDAVESCGEDCVQWHKLGWVPVELITFHKRGIQ